MTAHVRGRRDYIQGAARIACLLVRYLTKHQATMLASPNISSASLADLTTCIPELISCLQKLCNLKNKEER